MIRELVRPANIVTSLGLMCGVYSIVLAAGAEPGDTKAFHAAGMLIVFATIFDGIDGRIARITGGGSEFGSQLDSLVDIVAFGVAPGVLLYKWGLTALGPVGFFAAFAFVLAGTYRLARFNVRAARGELSNKDYSEGLTITFAGGMVAISVIYHHQLAPTVEMSAHLPVALFTLFLSYLMLSNIRFPAFKSVTKSAKGVAVVATGLFTTAVLAVFWRLSLMIIVVGSCYILWGLLAEIFIYGPRRRADDFMYLGSLEDEADLLSSDDDGDLPDLIEELEHRSSGPVRRMFGFFRRR